jgi:hypothetical protein
VEGRAAASLARALAIFSCFIYNNETTRSRFCQVISKHLSLNLFYVRVGAALTEIVTSIDPRRIAMASAEASCTRFRPPGRDLPSHQNEGADAPEARKALASAGSVFVSLLPATCSSASEEGR